MSPHMHIPIPAKLQPYVAQVWYVERALGQKPAVFSAFLQKAFANEGAAV
ncbi:hypothetical protein SAMN05421788_10265 [Filimonas lacunae]|uniref:Uncharacterized protein n=1 Tax=Filimonas lacunae TaxID=477680 RepID=A0A173MI56_9BACT|nr:hypothetical protein FLA_3335 [Filimonas lacunae]SIS91558.1 hypothetical protein SAMN05421788_10265 [Filimonas lacunae]